MNTLSSKVLSLLVEEAQPLADNPNFKGWFGSSKVVDSSGNPLRVYHGTTRDFSEFSRKYGTVENYHGRGFYFTSSPEDMNLNYAGEGPDLRGRIAREAERIFWAKFEFEEPSYGSEEYEKEMGRAEAIARRKLAVGRPVSMPVYLRIDNPVYVGGGDKETWFEFSFKEDREGNIVGESGSGARLFRVLRRLLGKYTGSYVANEEVVDRVLGELREGLGYDRFTATEFERVARGNADFNYAFENGKGHNASSQIIRDVYKTLGFDGIILDAGSTFKRMKGVGGATHFVVFSPNQVKSAIGNRGTFDPNSRNIRESL